MDTLCKNQQLNAWTWINSSILSHSYVGWMDCDSWLCVFFFKCMWGFVSNKSQPNNKIAICELLWLVNLFHFILRGSFFLSFLFFRFVAIIIFTNTRTPWWIVRIVFFFFFLCFAFFAVFISIICINVFINGCWSRYFDPDAIKVLSSCIHFIPFLVLERTCFVATLCFFLFFIVQQRQWLLQLAWTASPELEWRKTTSKKMLNWNNNIEYVEFHDIVFMTNYHLTSLLLYSFFTSTVCCGILIKEKNTDSSYDDDDNDNVHTL